MVDAASAAASASGSSGSAGADLDGERALAGRGHIVVGAERLGDGVEPARAGPGPRGRARRRRGRRGATGAREPGVDVAADVDDVEVGPGGAELGGAAGRAGADAGAGRAASRGSARPGRTARRAGPRAAGPPRARARPRRAVGRSLRECTATSQRPSSSASRRAVTKTPVPPRLCRRAGQAVAVGADVDGLEGQVATPRTARASTTMAGLRERERARAGPDPHVLEHAASVPLRRRDVEARGHSQNPVTGS